MSWNDSTLGQARASSRTTQPTLARPTGNRQMTSGAGFGQSKKATRTLCAAIAVAASLLASHASAAEQEFGGPTFRKGMWRFVRTLEILTASNGRHKLFEREMTRCVDPTQAMKGTFSSVSIGNCHSSKPEKVSNKYVFSNRCDYMGPVSTVITVLSEEAYTEVNEVKGVAPRTDRVVARRISDCHEDRASLGQPAGPHEDITQEREQDESEPL
jgi:hypothetical protein